MGDASENIIILELLLKYLKKFPKYKLKGVCSIAFYMYNKKIYTINQYEQCMYLISFHLRPNCYEKNKPYYWVKGDKTLRINAIEKLIKKIKFNKNYRNEN